MKEIVKERSAGSAGGLLQIAGGEVPGRAMKFEAHFTRHRGDEAFVFIGCLAAKFVIEMGDAGDADVQVPQDVE
jgi:hypothetical protein